MSIFAPNFPLARQSAAQETAGLWQPDNRNIAPRLWIPGRNYDAPVRLDPNAARFYGNVWLANSKGSGHGWIKRPIQVYTGFTNGKAAVGHNKEGSYATFASDSYYRYFINQNLTNLGDPVTLFGVAFISSAASETGTIIQLGNHVRKIYRISLTNDNRANFQIYDGGNPNTLLYTDAGVITDFQPYRVCAVQRTDTDRQLWVHDGSRIVSNTTNATSTVAASGELSNAYIGAAYNNGYASEMNGGIYMAGWAPYAWSNAQAMAWLQNPYKDIIPA